MKELVSAYNLFEDRISDISFFIQNMMCNPDVWRSFEDFDLSKTQRDLLHYIQSSSGKTIQYNAVIISLYGCFENYIDSIFSRYLDFVFSKVDTYDNLPNKIKEKYTSKLGEYLISPNRFYGVDIPKIKLIDDYLKVLNSNFEETVNKVFLLMHSGNLRIEQINTFMSEMGIEEARNKIFNNTLMKSFHLDILGFDEDEYRIKISRSSKDLSKYLDMLVEQRNSVAHGWVEENRISVNDFNTYLIPYMKVLAEVLLRIILCESFDLVGNKTDILNFQETPIDVYNNNIVCIHITGQAVSKGDYLIYKSNKKIKCAKIKCIQVDKKEFNSIAESECDIGIKLDERIAKTDKICLFVSH